MADKQPAYEVLRITQEYRNSNMPAKHKRVVTMWDKEQAEQLARVINDEAGEDIYNQPIVKRIGVLVVGDEAYYSTGRSPVPVSLVASDMNEAFAIIALAEQK